jgi:hypothetical protein
MSETINCRKCEREIPEESTFCMHCGAKVRLGPKSNQLPWPCEQLELAPNADITPLIDDLFPGEEVESTFEAVRWFLSAIIRTPKTRQVAIRFWGLDGKGRRNTQQIMKEVGVEIPHLITVKVNRVKRRARLLHATRVLKGLVPVRPL